MWCVTDRQEQDPALFCLCNVMNTMVQPSEFTAAFGTAVVNAVVKTNSDGKKLPKLSCL